MLPPTVYTTSTNLSSWKVANANICSFKNDKKPIGKEWAYLYM